MAIDGMSGGAGRVADPALLGACVHCGLCLNACPTYLELGTEADSPRGRIHLIRALEDGTLGLDAEVVRHLDLCLGCRACESACPSGVRYGRIIEDARVYLQRQAPRPWPDRLRERLVLATFPYRRRLRVLFGLGDLARRLGVWNLVAGWIDGAELLPAARGAMPAGSFFPARDGERLRVGLLAGCVAGELFGDVNAAAVRLLTRGGAAVVVPREQGCCGALHLHSGERETARVLARRLIDAFPAELDAVVVTAAGCGSALKEYGELLADDPLYRERAQRFAERVRDVTELLDAIGVTPPAAAPPRRVTYHDACHLAHAQGVREAPRRLLARIANLELVELSESDVCCGSAGSYNLTQPAMARRLRERKVDHILASGAECVAVANPGCALQIRAGLKARGSTVRVVHPVELLDEG
ncbi:MAG TPA: heterodisulfide reductase-related iron-sulfur binding cluster [Candidatus Dormibacteraeota bacterium]|nr:heterodisulfide reductase-related iron-sulfur binding cluster [Candidatus Dormibacteraeota bacterium]